MTLIRALHPHGSRERLKGQRQASLVFVLDRPAPEGTVARVKARHPAGDYTLPFLCRWSGGRWLNDRTATPVEADVIGWHAKAPSRALQASA